MQALEFIPKSKMSWVEGRNLNASPLHALLTYSDLTINRRIFTGSATITLSIL